MRRPGDMGVTVIVELLVFISSDYYAQGSGQTPPLLAICVKCDQKSAGWAGDCLCHPGGCGNGAMAEPVRPRQTKRGGNRYVRPQATAPHSDSTRDSVNREHLYPNAALRDRVLDERALVKCQRHQLCASVISSSALAIWTRLASPVCERTCDDLCRAPCSGVP